METSLCSAFVKGEDSLDLNMHCCVSKPSINWNRTELIIILVWNEFLDRKQHFDDLFVDCVELWGRLSHVGWDPPFCSHVSVFIQLGLTILNWLMFRKNASTGKVHIYDDDTVRYFVSGHWRTPDCHQLQASLHVLLFVIMLIKPQHVVFKYLSVCLDDRLFFIEHLMKKLKGRMGF